MEEKDLEKDAEMMDEQAETCEETSGEANDTSETSEVTEEKAEAADEAGSEENEEASSEEPKKSFFHKKEKKDKKDLQIEDLTDKLKRQMAEFENFRKRTEKEKAAMFEVGAKNTVEKILPIVDNFERGLGTLKDEEAHTPFAEGMDKVYKQLLAALESMDVKPIEAVGKEFNPDFHNAVMHVEDEEVGENIVVEEFQKGYTYRDSVVRHSMVKVAN